MNGIKYSINQCNKINAINNGVCDYEKDYTKIKFNSDVMAMFTVNVFEILLFKGRSVLSPTSRSAGSERAYPLQKV